MHAFFPIDVDKSKYKPPPLPPAGAAGTTVKTEGDGTGVVKAEFAASGGNDSGGGNYVDPNAEANRIWRELMVGRGTRSKSRAKKMGLRSV